MSFWSGLGNFVHNISTDVSSGYHDIFGNGNSSPVTTTTTTVAQRQQQNNQQNNQQQQNQQTPLQKADSSLNQVNANTLAKAKTVQQPDDTTTQTTTVAPQPQHPSLFHQITTGLQKKLAPSEEAVASAARTAEGAIQSTGELPNAISHGVNWAASKLSGQEGVQNPLTTPLQKATTAVVTKPSNAVASATDKVSRDIAASGATPQTTPQDLQSLYHQAQVVENVGLAAPGVVGIVKGASTLSKAGDVAEGLQKGDQLTPTLDDVASHLPDVSKGAQELSDLITVGHAATDAPEIASGVRGTNTALENELHPPAPAPETPGTAVTNTNPQVELEVQQGNVGESTGTNQPAPAETPNPTPPRPVETAPAPAPTEPVPTRPQPTTPPIDETDQTPAYLRRAQAAQQAQEAQAAQQAATDAKAADMGLGPNQMDRPAVFHRQDIQNVIAQGNAELNAFVEANPEATAAQIDDMQAQIEQRTTQRIQALQDARGGVASDVKPPAEPVAPTPTEQLNQLENAGQTAPLTPAEQTERAALQAETAPPTNPAEVQAAAEQTAPPELNQAPSNGEQVETAPNTRTAILKNLPGLSKDASKDSKLRNVTNLEDLTNTANANLANLDDGQLIDTFNGNLQSLPHNADSVAYLRAAINRLDKLDPAKNPDAVDALENALDEYQARSSGAGLIQRYVQQDFDSMPKAMKVKYIIRQIDKANAGVKDYAPLAEDPAKAEKVEQAISDYLTSGEHINERISELQGKLDAVMQAAKDGKVSDENIGQVKSELTAAKTDLRQNNANILHVFQDNTPKGPLGARAAQAQKSMMLASVSGRTADILNTGANVLHLGAENLTRGMLAKAANFVKPGMALDTSKGFGTFLRGSLTGAKSGLTDLAKGDRQAGDLVKALKGQGMDRGDLTAPRGRFTNFIHNFVNLPEKMSQGVHDQNLLQQADREAQQLGLAGEERQQYAAARAANPTPAMEQRASELRDSVNNMADNPISRAFASVANIPGAALGLAGKDLPEGSKLAGAGKIVGNLYLPFTRVLGGMTWSALTDKNVVANGINFARAARHGDVDGMIANVAKAGVNGIGAMSLGAALTRMGVITNTDPEGYNDEGAYINIGGHSIPVSMFGFFAPGLVMGNAWYKASSDGSGRPAPAVLTKTLGDSLTAGAKAFGTMQALGADNPISKTITALQAQNSKVTPFDLVAQEAGQGIGEYVPAIGHDINAGLDYSHLNPTHEKADLSVKNVDPMTGKPTNKNYLASAEASVENKIPGVSQTLPRKAGAAAADFLSRATRGSSISATQAQDAADKVDLAAQSKDDKANNIPDPTGKFPGSSFDQAIQTRVENGDYGSAIPALQQKLAIEQKNPNLPKSTETKLNNKITQLQVIKDNKISQDDLKLYNKTSLSDWRNMGDPKKDAYDPATYQKLWNLDKTFADKGVAGGFVFAPGGPSDVSSTQKFSAKTIGAKETAAKDAKAAADRIKSNTIGSLPSIGMQDLSSLAPQKVSSTAAIPTIQALRPDQLVKARQISVTKVK